MKTLRSFFYGLFLMAYFAITLPIRTVLMVFAMFALVGGAPDDALEWMFDDLKYFWERR